MQRLGADHNMNMFPPGMVECSIIHHLEGFFSMNSIVSSITGAGDIPTIAGSRFLLVAVWQRYLV